MQHCVKSVQVRTFFWSVFSYIRTPGQTRDNITKQRSHPQRQICEFSCWWNLIFVEKLTFSCYSSCENNSKYILCCKNSEEPSFQSIFYAKICRLSLSVRKMLLLLPHGLYRPSCFLNVWKIKWWKQ